MGTTLESFAALDAALLPAPPNGCSAPLVEVGRGSGSGCRALLVYVTVELLIRCAALPTEIRCHLIKVRMIMLV
ncbi:hypothetical protein E4N62_44660 [Streptomyces sp. MNU76]|uniref:hypothetical protein n=1 Tax=Streptomyces sp. MNU76 TaxID=2560026 RepID=UPI001E618479|nr:hypothetical protein [Streptomyces sp. MNU76]MCC9711685.1 hypothetical protein [Streptomyces sp. MNU76]